MPSILQDWVTDLGLRHQGVLLSCCRGCDGVGKEDPSKAVIRVLRGVLFKSFSAKPSSFIEVGVVHEDLEERFTRFLRDFDHLPVHYVMHLMFAAEIVGYKHPTSGTRVVWSTFYTRLVHKMHLRTETESRLDYRLNAPEDAFSAQQNDG